MRLSWDDVAERGVDPVTDEFDFEGYRIYRSTDPDFRDPQGRDRTRRGNPSPATASRSRSSTWSTGSSGYSQRRSKAWRTGSARTPGITHTWTDTTVTNGQQYYYAVCAYDYGCSSRCPTRSPFYPSENSIAVSRTPRGGLDPAAATSWRCGPNPRVPGLRGRRSRTTATTSPATAPARSRSRS